MSFWSLMNWVTWGLSAMIVFLLIVDVIKVEKQRANEKNAK